MAREMKLTKEPPKLPPKPSEQGAVRRVQRPRRVEGFVGAGGRRLMPLTGAAARKLFDFRLLTPAERARLLWPAKR